SLRPDIVLGEPDWAMAEEERPISSNPAAAAVNRAEPMANISFSALLPVRLHGSRINIETHALFENQNLAVIPDRHRVRGDARAFACDVDGLICRHSAFAHVEEGRF